MKSILVTAGLAACSACAVAQTNVTIYGVVDAAMQAARTGGQTTTRVESSSVGPSRIGFQGTEDIKPGLQAVFRLENGFNADTGASFGNGALFGREAWVGLNSKEFGTLTGGLNYTPIFISFATYSQGTLNTLGWGNATNNFTFIPALRVPNSLRYTSPTLGGVTVRAIYSLGTENASTPRNIGRTAGMGLNYKNGPLSIDADYMTQRYATSGTLTAATPVGQGRYALAAASYDLGWITPAFIYENHSGSSDVAAPIGSANANPDHWLYELNAIIKAGGNGSFLVSFGQYKKKASSSGDATSYGLRYDYKLSKRTGLYAGVGRVENGSTASFTINNASSTGIPTTPGSSLNGVIVGMLHRF